MDQAASRQRVIETNLKDAAASVHYEGLGYEGKSGDLMLDENGVVDLGENNNPERSKFPAHARMGR